MITPKRIDTLLVDWHEAGRDNYNTMHRAMLVHAPQFTYDQQRRKTATRRRKYIALDEGGSGVWLIDQTDGMVYAIKAYGVPNKKKCLGHVDTITGQDLHDHHWWGDIR